MVQIIREHSIDWPASGSVELDAPAISITVPVSPAEARRRANGYLGSELAMALLALNPRLIVNDRIVWRLDIFLALPELGPVALLDVVDVDAQTGQVIPLSDPSALQLLERADALASRFTPSATSAG